jgi:PAS domain-containing protein
MRESLTAFGLGDTSTLVVVAVACFLLGSLAPRTIERILSAFGLAKGWSGKGRLLVQALDNIPQAFCVFDSMQRLVACNKRYAELHGLNERLVRPGTTLRQIFEHRVAMGKYPGGDPKKYIDERLASVRENKPNQTVIKLNDGTVVQTSRKPMQGGGWVATDEDVTERHLVEQERAAHAELERRRSVVDEAIGSLPGDG